MPPKERGVRKIISVKMPQNGCESKMLTNDRNLNHNENILHKEEANKNTSVDMSPTENKNGDFQNMIISSKTLEMKITNSENINGTEKIKEITNNNLESNTNLNNKVAPQKRGRKIANVPAENVKMMSETVDVIPVVDDKIESLDKQNQKSTTTESISLDKNGSEVSKADDKAESNAKVDVLDDENKKVPLRRGRQKKVGEETSDKQLQTKEKAPLKRELRKANIPLEEDKLSDFKKTDEEPSEKISDEQLQAEEKIPSKRGRKKANPLKPDKKEMEVVNDEKPSDTIPDEQIQTEGKTASRRGRKKDNIPIKPDKTFTVTKMQKKDTNDPSEEQSMPSKRGEANIPLKSDKLSGLKEIDENNEELSEKILDEQLQAEEKISSKRGRKKANSDKKKIEDDNDEKPSDTFPDEQSETGYKIRSKRARKNAIVPSKFDKSSDLKTIKEEMNEEESSSITKKQKKDKNVSSEEQNMPSKRGRKKVNKKETVEIFTKKESSEDFNEPSQDIITEENSERNVKVAKKNTRGAKNKKQGASSHANKLSPVRLKRKNETAAEEIDKNKHGFNETKVLKVRLQRDDIIDKMCEEQTKITEVCKAKNTKAGGKRAKEDADSKDVRLKRKNETAAEEIDKNKHGFNETKVLKVRLQHDDIIDKICEEQTKITEVGKAKNTKAGSKREKEDADSKDSEEKSPKKPKGEPKSKGQSKKDKMPDVTLLDFNNNSTSPTGKPWNLKISSWNVNGIRAWLEKDGLAYITHENPDVVALQETKCSDKMLPKEVNIAGYHAYWLAGDKDGYSGVGLLSKKEPVSVNYGIGVEEHDKEGRVITAEYEEFYLVATYIPNAGRGLVRLNYRMQWDKDFRSYIKNLDEKKPVVLCGDLNVAHEEIDLSNPKTNKKNAGFTKEEREGFSALLSEGFIDSFRHLYPEEKGAYTFWTYMMNARAKNVGWRLDYFVLSKKLTDHLCDNLIRKDVYGSDHCPITLFLCV